MQMCILARGRNGDTSMTTVEQFADKVFENSLSSIRNTVFGSEYLQAYDPYVVYCIIELLALFEVEYDE